jgi:tetratricopeptide (TPR) repeat protein
MKTRFFLPLAIAAAIFTAQPVFAQNINELGQQGSAAQDAGNFSTAEQIFRRVISIDPTNGAGYNNLGIALASQGNFVEAISNFRSAIRLNPNNAPAHNNLGNALSEQGNLVESIASYRTAIQVSPNYTTAYYNLGIALKKQGNLAEAIVSYRNAIRLNPNYANAYLNLGNILASQGNFAEAVTNFRNAVRLNPNDADIQDNLRRAEQSLAAGGGASPATTGANILQESGVLGDSSQVLRSDGSLFNTHTFTGRAGQVIEINLISSEFDTYLAILSASGEVLGQNDDVREGNTNSFLRVTLPSAGTYTIVVNGLEKTSRGRYNLSVTAP